MDFTIDYRYLSRNETTFMYPTFLALEIDEPNTASWTSKSCCKKFFSFVLADFGSRTVNYGCTLQSTFRGKGALCIHPSGNFESLSPTRKSINHHSIVHDCHTVVCNLESPFTSWHAAVQTPQTEHCHFCKLHCCLAANHQKWHM